MNWWTSSINFLVWAWNWPLSLWLGYLYSKWQWWRGFRSCGISDFKKQNKTKQTKKVTWYVPRSQTALVFQETWSTHLGPFKMLVTFLVTWCVRWLIGTGMLLLYVGYLFDVPATCNVELERVGFGSQGLDWRLVSALTTMEEFELRDPTPSLCLPAVTHNYPS